MKNIILSIVSLLPLLCACNDTHNQAQSHEEPLDQKTVSHIETQEDSELTSKCIIDGNVWDYTEVSGVIVTDKQKNLRIAKITFTKILDKGKEHLSLEYNAETGELISGGIQLKFPAKGGGRVHGIFSLTEESSTSGTIDLQDEGVAHGQATLTNLEMQYEWNKLENPEHKTISVAEINFSEVGYSDVAKEMEKLFNNNAN
jgi:hypothetical protein